MCETGFCICRILKYDRSQQFLERRSETEMERRGATDHVKVRSITRKVMDYSILLSREAQCDMKIKEMGLTGKSAILRKQSNLPGGRKGFNAFREMEREKSGKAGKSDKPKPEIWLEFMGAKIRVYEDDGGSIKDEDVPYVKGSALKFSGCGGKINFEDIKASNTILVTMSESEVLFTETFKREVLTSTICTV